MEMNRSLLALVASARSWAIDPGYGITSLMKAHYNIEAGVAPAKIVNFHGYMNRSGQISNESDSGLAYHEITGPMMFEDGVCSDGIQSWARNFETIDLDQNIKGHLVRLNTGGGEASAGIAAYEALRNATKPVVVLGDFVGSAGYMTASGGREIIASSEMSEFGSIGVMMSISTEMLNFFKTDVLSLYARTSPDKNLDWRALVNGDTGPMIDSLDIFDQGFMEIVKRERGLRSGRVLDRETLQGSMYFAKDAKERGLIDAIGNKKFAVNRLLKLINN